MAPGQLLLEGDAVSGSALVPTGGLPPMDQAKQAIALAVRREDIDWLMKLRNAAEAQRLFEIRQDKREEANNAGEWKVRAERGLGQVDAKHNPRGRPGKDGGAPTFSLDVEGHRRAAWRRLGKISDARFDKFIQAARADEEGGVSTAQLIRYLRTGSEGASVTFECYTPAVYVDQAREVLGDIDLDPASAWEANETVGARTYFTEEDDGLAHEWHGTVFLNPPYGRSLTSEFTAKLIEEYDAGRVTAAILLINAYGFDAKWFQPLWDHTLCFTDHRIPFYGGGPTFGSLFVYLGNDSQRFADTFRRFGSVLRRWP